MRAAAGVGTHCAGCAACGHSDGCDGFARQFPADGTHWAVRPTIQIIRGSSNPCGELVSGNYDRRVTQTGRKKNSLRRKCPPDDQSVQSRPLRRAEVPGAGLGQGQGLLCTKRRTLVGFSRPAAKRSTTHPYCRVRSAYPRDPAVAKDSARGAARRGSASMVPRARAFVVRHRPNEWSVL